MQPRSSRFSCLAGLTCVSEGFENYDAQSYAPRLLKTLNALVACSLELMSQTSPAISLQTPLTTIARLQVQTPSLHVLGLAVRLWDHQPFGPA